MTIEEVVGKLVNYKDSVYQYMGGVLTIRQYLGAYEFNATPHRVLRYRMSETQYYKFLYLVNKAGYKKIVYTVNQKVSVSKGKRISTKLNRKSNKRVKVTPVTVHYFQKQKIMHNPVKAKSTGLKGTARCLKCKRTFGVTLNTKDETHFCPVCKPKAVVPAHIVNLLERVNNTLKTGTMQGLKNVSKEDRKNISLAIKAKYICLKLIKREGTYYVGKMY